MLAPGVPAYCVFIASSEVTDASVDEEVMLEPAKDGAESDDVDPVLVIEELDPRGAGIPLASGADTLFVWWAVGIGNAIVTGF